MAQKLLLKKNRLRNEYLPAKVRQWDEVPLVLRTWLDELCEGKRKWPLFLHGSVGAGKSCAALCLVDRVEGSKFWAMPRFVALAQNVREGREEWYNCGQGGRWSEEKWWQVQIGNLPLLVLDDVGLSEVNSNFHLETLFLALEARDGKPLVCTSNLNPEEIATTYNDRIRSRMCSGTVYELSGRDRRYAL